MAWARYGHGMASVNQTRTHCVNQMGKTYFKSLAARYGRGTSWAWHGHGMLCVNRPLSCCSACHLAWQVTCQQLRHTTLQGMYSTELSFIVNATLQECYILQFCIIKHFLTTAITRLSDYLTRKPPDICSHSLFTKYL